jgi:Kef-type K+ transport system membrane component KefB
LILFLLLSTAQVLGYVFTRLRQQRVIGEIAAGVLLGPFVLSNIAPALRIRSLPATAGRTSCSSFSIRSA